MLDAIAKLAQHGVRDIEWILRHEKYAHAFGADQAHDLLDFVEQGLRRIGEEQMRLVEEENELGLFGIADFRQPFVEFRQ